MSDKPKVLTYITVSFLEDGTISITSDADLINQITLLKTALEDKLYTAATLLEKAPNGFVS